MTRKANRKTELPAHVAKEAESLKALFKKHVRLTQEAFGETYGLGTQGNVWQYLNGWLEMNTDVAAKFARGIGRPVREFSPRLAAEIDDLTRRAATGEPTRVHRHPLSDRGKDLAAEWEQLDERLKVALELVVYTLGAARARGEPLPALPSLAQPIRPAPDDEIPASPSR